MPKAAVDTSIPHSEMSEKELVSELERMYAIDPLVAQIEEGQSPKIPSQKELEKRHDSAVATLTAILQEKKTKYAGYQNNQDLHFSKHFGSLLDIHLNNIGDTYLEGGVRTSTKAAERALIRFFSRLWRAPKPASATVVPPGKPLPHGLQSAHVPEYFNEAWGCVLTMGCTEGNMYALRNARDYLKGKFLLPELYGRPNEVPVARADEDTGKERLSILPQPHQRSKQAPAQRFPLSHPSLMRGGVAAHGEDLQRGWGNGYANGNGSESGMHDADHAQRATDAKDTTTTTSSDSTSAGAGAITGTGAGTGRRHTEPEHPPESVMLNVKEARQLPTLRLVRAHRTPGATTSQRRSTGTPGDRGTGAHLRPQGEQPTADEREVERGLEAEVAAEARDLTLNGSTTSTVIGSTMPPSVDSSTRTTGRATGVPESSSHVHEPVLLYSSSSHYSIDKIRDLLEMGTPETIGNVFYPGECPLTQHLSGSLRGAWPGKVPVHVDGRIQVEALVTLAHFFTSRGHPIVVVVTYGTTFAGSHEDPARIYRALRDAGCLHQDTYKYTIPRASAEDASAGDVEHLHYTLTRRNYWIHVDGALGAFYGPYFSQEDKDRRAATASLLDMKEEELPRLPSMGFNVGAEDSEEPNSGVGAVMSIAMSGHKQCGAPFPTGIVMTLRRYMLDYQTISYIAAGDTTLAGSRNGHSPLLMWSNVARHTDADHARMYLRQVQLARVFAKTMADALGCGVNEYGGLIFNSPHSLSVVLPRPTQEIIDYYSLSCDTVRYPSPYEGYKDNAIVRTSVVGDESARGKVSVGNEDMVDEQAQNDKTTSRGVGGGVWAPDFAAAHTFVMEHWTEEFVCALVRAISSDSAVKQAVQEYKTRVARAGGALPPIYNDQGALLDVWGRPMEPECGPFPPVEALDWRAQPENGKSTRTNNKTAVSKQKHAVAGKDGDEKEERETKRKRVRAAASK